MKRLEPLLGSWTMEAVVEDEVVARGRMVNEWIEDGAFLRQKVDGDATTDLWRNQTPFPTTAIVGLDDSGDEFTVLYADARGVWRIYSLAFEGRSWRMWRLATGFNQRFIGDLSADGTEIDGRWEASPDGDDWSLDFNLRYRRTQE